jgi:hypothetical protein
MLYPHDRRCPCNPVSDRRPRQAARWRFEWEFNRYQLAPQRLKLAPERAAFDDALLARGGLAWRDGWQRAPIHDVSTKKERAASMS